MTSSILALVLTLIKTEDMSIVPGLTSRNAIVIFKEGQGTDGDATIKKFGINYSVSLSKSEGHSQALRNVVELAVIELFGKLTKTPYWRCLGSDPTDEAVSDWYDSLYVNRAEFVSYFQVH